MRVEQGADALAQPQALESGGGEHDGVGFAGVQLGQPGVDVAAQQPDLQVGPAVLELGLAAQAGGADPGAAGQVVEAGVAVRDQGVAGVLPLGKGGERQAGRLGGGHVLQRVDGAVDLAVQQGGLDLLGEQGLAPDLQQPPVLDAVAGGGDEDQGGDALGLFRRGAEGGGDAGLHLARLGAGQARSARADADDGHARGL